MTKLEFTQDMFDKIRDSMAYEVKYCFNQLDEALLDSICEAVRDAYGDDISVDEFDELVDESYSSVEVSITLANLRGNNND